MRFDRGSWPRESCRFVAPALQSELGQVAQANTGFWCPPGARKLAHLCDTAARSGAALASGSHFTRAWGRSRSVAAPLFQRGEP